MPQRLTLKEPCFRGYTPDAPFGLYENGVPLFEVIRLLRGSVDIRDKRSFQLFKIYENETRIGVPRSARPQHIFKYLLGDSDGDEGISFLDFETFIAGQKHLNLKFFEKLRADLAMCIVAKKVGRHTESFLHFYRILEHVSLAFPLTYALHESDFKKAHEFLKDLFKNEKDGDLAAMKTFIPKIGKIGGYDTESFDFKFDCCVVDDAKACLVELRKCFHPDGGIIRFPEDADALEFSVSFNSMHSFIIQFRNKMFHDRAGETNFDLSSIGGSEILCQVLMQESLHWFSKLYAEIVRSIMNRNIP